MIISKKVYSIKIDSVLNSSGTKSLLFDANGYYHLMLDVRQNQTLSRVTGKLLVDGKEPYPPEKIDWESNLYWWLKKGDTVAYITKAYVNYFTGQYTIVNLPPLIASKDELVPTSNFASYTGKGGGEINNMIAPIYRMKGDTLVLKAMHTFSNQIVYTKIVLEESKEQGAIVELFEWIFLKIFIIIKSTRNINFKFYAIHIKYLLLKIILFSVYLLF